MTQHTRRAILAGLGSTAALAACGNGVGSNGSATIDARVDQTLNYLYTTYPATTQLRDKSVGQLVMPLVTKAGFFAGGSYGRGALRIGGATVDYYSATSGSFGLQIGAQQSAHVLFFMTDNALRDFRFSDGWTAGADLEYAVKDDGGAIVADTTTSLAPVVAVVFGQVGLLVGASLRGTKYARIIP
ncbi:lipid-binding SYLF domain-containing protein [Anianabacter salinae]|uniref:lipid-binding SYLF domain-containing protein n=1 Tax=Anianabacter salinae TaxID=2851023 RepID=UPI00225E224D|nr:YSC84-related protein [Anianabacter salinae]MBV0912132.1 twin-arginine translocation pathway signal [Anianabacter salinae]